MVIYTYCTVDKTFDQHRHTQRNDRLLRRLLITAALWFDPYS